MEIRLEFNNKNADTVLSIAAQMLLLQWRFVSWAWPENLLLLNLINQHLGALGATHFRVVCFIKTEIYQTAKTVSVVRQSRSQTLQFITDSKNPKYKS